MNEINLLDRYPKTKRAVAKRLPNKEFNREIAGRFGREYFDGHRTEGYGGYQYDGRWVPVAQRFIEHWKLKAGDRVLDVGCAKGFLVKDLIDACPGLEVFGIDVSQYAIENGHPDVRDRLFVGDVRDIRFPDGFFHGVISINAIHNLESQECPRAIREIQRVSSKSAYIQVDSYRSEEERERFLNWMLTCKTHYYPAQWHEVFREAGYQGEFYFTYVDD